MGRDDARRSSGGIRRGRSRSTRMLMQEKNPRELRSKSTSRLPVEDLEKSDKARGRSTSQLRETSNLQASHLEAGRPGRMTRSMSAARDLVGNGGRGDCRKNWEGGRRNITREERREATRQWGSSWRQLEGRGVTIQQEHEEKTFGRMRSISTGRIPLKGPRSISSSIGIGAIRVRQILCTFFNFPPLVSR